MCDFNLASEQASRESMFPCLSDERSNMHRKNSSRMAREVSLVMVVGSERKLDLVSALQLSFALDPLA